MKKKSKNSLSHHKPSVLLLGKDYCKTTRSPSIASPLNLISTNSHRAMPSLPKLDPEQKFSDIFPQWLLSRQDFQDTLHTHSSDLNPSSICLKPHYQRDPLEVRALKSWTKECLFFQHLTEYAANEVRKKLRTLNFEKGYTIFKQNDPGDCLYLIAKGLVEINKAGVGVIDIVGPKNTIGESAIENNSLRNATIIAKSPVSLLLLKIDDYNDIVRRQKHRERFDMVDYLKSIPFFNSFFGSKLERVAWNLYPMQYKKGQVVYSIHDDPVNFYIIRQGSVKMEKTVSIKLKSRMPYGNKSEKYFVRERTYLQVLRECSSEDFFGEEEIIKGTNRGCKAICMKNDTILWLLNKDVFLSVFTDKDLQVMMSIHAERPTSKSLKIKLKNDFLGFVNKFEAILDATKLSPIPVGRDELNKKESMIKKFADKHVSRLNDRLVEEKVIIEPI